MPFSIIIRYTEGGQFTNQRFWSNILTIQTTDWHEQVVTRYRLSVGSNPITAGNEYSALTIKGLVYGMSGILIPC